MWQTIVYFVVLVILFGLYAWLCGQIEQDDYGDNSVYPILFFAIIVWPATIVLIAVMAPFIAINTISSNKRDAKIKAVNDRFQQLGTR